MLKIHQFMLNLADNKPERFLLVCFMIFLFASTFSIALSQSALGFSLGAFFYIVYKGSPQVRLGHIRYIIWGAVIWTVWLMTTTIIGGHSPWLDREEWLIAIVPMAAWLLRREGRLRLFMTVFAFGMIVMGIYGLIQYFTGVSLFSSRTLDPAPRFGWRVMGTFAGLVTFGNVFGLLTTTFAGYLLGVFDTLGKKLKLLFIAALSLGGLVTILSFRRASTGAVIMTLVLLAIIQGRRYRKAAVGLLLALVLAIILVPGISDPFVNRFNLDFGGTHFAGRVFIWKHVSRIIGEHPFFGVGDGNFEKEYIAQLDPNASFIYPVSTAHNDFLHMTAISGFPGLVLFTGLWGLYLGLLWRGSRLRSMKDPESRAAFLAALGGTVCFLVISVFHGAWVDEEVRVMLMVVWAIGLSGWLSDKRAVS